MRDTLLGSLAELVMNIISFLAGLLFMVLGGLFVITGLLSQAGDSLGILSIVVGIADIIWGKALFKLSGEDRRTSANIMILGGLFLFISINFSQFALICVPIGILLLLLGFLMWIKGR